MRLDFSKPYAEVHGQLGAVYEQNGLLYRGDGSPATNLQDIPEEVFVKDDSIPPPVCVIESPSLPIESTERNLQDMHWRHLKALVESFGGEWTNRLDAIKFMEGKE